MHSEVADKSNALIRLCVEYGVQRLELFGSATGDSFDPDRSDVDFLVVFEPTTPVEHADRYFELLAALQDLFSRGIDLVELGAIRNPYFMQGIQSSRMLIYAA